MAKNAINRDVFENLEVIHGFVKVAARRYDSKMTRQAKQAMNDIIKMSRVIYSIEENFITIRSKLWTIVECIHDHEAFLRYDRDGVEVLYDSIIKNSSFSKKQHEKAAEWLHEEIWNDHDDKNWIHNWKRENRGPVSYHLGDTRVMEMTENDKYWNSMIDELSDLTKTTEDELDVILTLDDLILAMISFSADHPVVKSKAWSLVEYVYEHELFLFLDTTGVGVLLYTFEQNDQFTKKQRMKVREWLNDPVWSNLRRSTRQPRLNRLFQRLVREDR